MAAPRHNDEHAMGPLYPLSAGASKAARTGYDQTAPQAAAARSASTMWDAEPSAAGGGFSAASSAALAPPAAGVHAAAGGRRVPVATGGVVAAGAQTRIAAQAGGGARSTPLRDPDEGADSAWGPGYGDGEDNDGARGDDSRYSWGSATTLSPRFAGGGPECTTPPAGSQEGVSTPPPTAGLATSPSPARGYQEPRRAGAASPQLIPGGAAARNSSPMLMPGVGAAAASSGGFSAVSQPLSPGTGMAGGGMGTGMAGGGGAPLPRWGSAADYAAAMLGQAHGGAAHSYGGMDSSSSSSSAGVRWDGGQGVRPARGYRDEHEAGNGAPAHTDYNYNSGATWAASAGGAYDGGYGAVAGAGYGSSYGGGSHSEEGASGSLLALFHSSGDANGYAAATGASSSGGGSAGAAHSVSQNGYHDPRYSSSQGQGQGRHQEHSRQQYHQQQLLQQLQPRQQQQRQAVHPQHVAPAAAREIVSLPRHRALATGLHNLGNTCFMNSTLQCLAHLRPYKEWLFEHRRVCGGSRIAGNPCVCCMQAQLFFHRMLHITQGGGQAVEPRALADCLPVVGRRFRVGRLEDAQEYLVQLLDLMERHCLRRAPPAGAAAAGASPGSGGLRTGGAVAGVMGGSRPVLAPLAGPVRPGAQSSSAKAAAMRASIAMLAAGSASSRASGSEEAHAAPAGALPAASAAAADDPAPDSLPVCTLFRGRLVSRVSCKNEACGANSDKMDPFETLSLEISGVNSVWAALGRFTAQEVLDGDNRYRCEKCKQLVRATKGMHVSVPPQILAVHLKRFTFRGFSSKDPHAVRHSEQLDLGKFMTLSDSQRAALVAAGRAESAGTHVSVTYTLQTALFHQGHSAQSGHYFAFVKGDSAPDAESRIAVPRGWSHWQHGHGGSEMVRAAGAWFEMNDDTVEALTPEQVRDSLPHAYMLFYTADDPELVRILTESAPPPPPPEPAPAPAPAPAAAAAASAASSSSSGSSMAAPAQRVYGPQRPSSPVYTPGSHRPSSPAYAPGSPGQHAASAASSASAAAATAAAAAPRNAVPGSGGSSTGSGGPSRTSVPGGVAAVPAAAVAILPALPQALSSSGGSIIPRKQPPPPLTSLSWTAPATTRWGPPAAKPAAAPAGGRMDGLPAAFGATGGSARALGPVAAAASASAAAAAADRALPVTAALARAAAAATPAAMPPPPSRAPRVQPPGGGGVEELRATGVKRSADDMAVGGDPLVPAGALSAPSAAAGAMAGTASDEPRHTDDAIVAAGRRAFGVAAALRWFRKPAASPAAGAVTRAPAGGLQAQQLPAPTQSAPVSLPEPPAHFNPPGMASAPPASAAALAARAPAPVAATVAAAAPPPSLAARDMHAGKVVVAAGTAASFAAMFADDTDSDADGDGDVAMKQ